MNSNFNEGNPPENKEKIINTKAKNDSQSINESVQIIIDESYKNKSLNLNPVKKKEKEKEKTKEKNDLYQDKELFDDKTVYFTNKLKDYNKSYQSILYVSIFIYIIDIIIWFKREKILYNYYSLFATLMILFSNIYQAYIFRHNFELISKELFIFVGKIIYIHLVFFVLFIVNVMYIFISNLLQMAEIKYIYGNKNIHNILIIIYCFINICIPCIHLFALIFVKNGIKDLSISRGEFYENKKIGDVGIVQSVINEI
jgi:hypothetical protein